MDGLHEFSIEVDGMSIEQDKSEVVLLMLIETEYRIAMTVINN